jgi:hypothetical protein
LLKILDNREVPRFSLDEFCELSIGWEYLRWTRRCTKQYLTGYVSFVLVIVGIEDPEAVPCIFLIMLLMHHNKSCDVYTVST